NKRADMLLGVIPIDSIFSPVIRVKYSVENTRVGQRTDYDKLILEIWTDGRITPDDALLQASAILRYHLDVFVNYDDGQIEFDEKPEEVNQENTRLKIRFCAQSAIAFCWTRSDAFTEYTSITNVFALVCFTGNRTTQQQQLHHKN